MEIKEGTGATLIVGSDRYPLFVEKVVSYYKSGKKKGEPKEVLLRYADHKADTSKENGQGHQNWIITPSTDSWEVTAKNLKYGWSVDGSPIRFGTAEYFYDWSF